MFHRVLVPLTLVSVDGSRSSEQVLGCLALLAHNLLNTDAPMLVVPLRTRS